MLTLIIIHMEVLEPNFVIKILYILKICGCCTDNWALVYSQELANKYRVPLMVAFTLVPKFLDATWRQYSFMISGLQEVEKVRINL